MQIKTSGQIAYEAELTVRPNYEDGTPRKSWDRLGVVERTSWEHNPTPRWSNPFAAAYTKELAAYLSAPMIQHTSRVDVAAEILVQKGCPTIVAVAALVAAGIPKQACARILQRLGYKKLLNPDVRWPTHWYANYQRFVLYRRCDVPDKDVMFAASEFLGGVSRGE